MPLYDIAVMQLPTQAEAMMGVQSKLIVGPKTISAKDGHAALLIAGSEFDLPEGLNKDLIEIKVRSW